LSLRGFGEYHHLNPALTDGVRLVIVAGLAEIHYLFSVIPGVILVGFARRARAVQLPLAVGGLILLFSSSTAGFVGFEGSEMASQARLVAAELILLVGLAAATLRPDAAVVRNRSEPHGQPHERPADTHGG